MSSPLIPPVFLILLLPLLASCRLEQLFPHQSQTASAAQQNSSDSLDSVSQVPPPDLSPDSMLTVLVPLQNAVYTSPSDTAARTSLLAASFDTASGSFLVVGKGVPNPSDSAAAVEAGRERAAESDAKRWSLYLKAWHTGDEREFGVEIEGKVAYARHLAEEVSGDTLIQLWQIPVGSVVVE